MNKCLQVHSLELVVTVSQLCNWSDLLFAWIVVGDKFVIHSILFKLARDTDVTKGQAAKPYYMYAADSDGPSYEFAMKTAAHEMRYAGQLAKHLSFAGKTRVCIPMYTIVDSLGFRLLAMPLMPLKGGQQVCLWL